MASSVPGRLPPRLAPSVALSGPLERGRTIGPMRPTRVRPRAALAVLLGTLLASSRRAVASATEFPAGKTGYHSYTEVAADIAAMAAAHPDIVQRFSIGKSYQGREMWAVKVSDNVDGRRARARGPLRRRHPLRRAHGRRDDAAHPPLARRRLRQRHADHEHREHPRDLDRLRGQPRRRRVRHLRRPVPLLAQEPPADAGHELDRHRPQPELRLSLGRRRPDELEPGGDHLPRADGLLGARDAGDARLPGQPRRRRPAADPRRDHVPRERPAGDVAVRLHLHEHPGRHDRPRTTPRSSAIGKQMAATNGYKPEQASDLYISSGTTRDYEYGMYRIFAYTFEMSPDNVAYQDDSLIAAETGPQQGGGPVPDGAGLVPARRARARTADGPLRRLRRRLRGRPRLDVEPGRDRHGAGDAPVRARQPGGDDVLGRRSSSRTTTVGRDRARDRCRRPDPPRTPTTSTAGRPPARRRSRSRPRPASG